MNSCVVKAQRCSNSVHQTEWHYLLYAVITLTESHTLAILSIAVWNWTLTQLHTVIDSKALYNVSCNLGIFWDVYFQVMFLWVCDNLWLCLWKPKFRNNMLLSSSSWIVDWRWRPLTFERNMLPLPSEYLMYPSDGGSSFYSDDGVKRLLWNLNMLEPKYMAAHSRFQ
jgi:hypothetical protein